MMADKQESHADNLALESHGFHCLHLATSHMQYIARDSHEKTNTHYINGELFPLCQSYLCCSVLLISFDLLDRCCALL